MAIAQWEGLMMTRVAPRNILPPMVTPSAAKVGDVLTLDTGLWSNASVVEIQWNLAGVPIPGAVGSTLNSLGLVAGLLTADVKVLNVIGVSTTVSSNSVNLTLF